MQSDQPTDHRLIFLPQELPIEIRQTMPERLVDVYLPDNPSLHPRLRLRRQADRYEITREPLGAGSEQTIGLDRHEFESLMAGHSRRIEKDRYRVVISGRPADIDVFSGELTGLALISFRFLNPSDKASFMPPTCCLADVSQEAFVSGGELAGKSYDDLAKHLEKYKYQPLSL